MNTPIQNPTAPSEAADRADQFFGRVGPKPTAYDELRRFPRFFYRTVAEVLIYPVADDAEQAPQKHTVVTCDLSRGGFSLQHVARLVRGQRLDIILNDQPPRPAEVLWCRHADGGDYAVGCRFVKR